MDQLSNPRISRETMFMDMARTVACRGTCLRKQVGAVMVRNNRVVSLGYNGAPPRLPHCTTVGCGGGHRTPIHGEQGRPNGGGKMVYPNGCTRAIHAEMNAVAFAARQGAPTDDATMYCTCATCANCAALLVSSGIKCFVYLEPYRLTAGIDLLTEAGIEVVQWKSQEINPAM